MDHALFNTALAFYTFTLPICRPATDFLAAFANFIDHPPTSALLNKATNAKLALINAMANRSISYEQKLVVLEDYLLALNTIYESLAAQGGVKVAQHLYFDWILSLSGMGESFRCTDMVFELIMLLHLRAQLYYYHARSLLDSDVKTFLSEAAKHFLQAAATMDCLQTRLSSGPWSHRLHTSQPNPPEATPAICEALGSYYRACAQVCAMLKAQTNPAASSNVRARVAVAALNALARSLDQFRHTSLSNAPFYSQIAMLRQLCTSLAYLETSKHCHASQQVGTAIGGCDLGLQHLGEQPTSKFDPTKGGFPKDNLCPPDILKARGALIGGLNELRVQADRDNRFVHFQRVEPATLPAEAAVLQPPTPYLAPPADQLITFTPNNRPSFFSSLFGLHKGSSTTDASPASASAEATEQLPPHPYNQVYPGLQTDTNNSNSSSNPSANTHAPSAPPAPST
jgi:hypothetical protein